MKIYYGVDNNKINVTKQCLESCIFNNLLYVPVELRVPLFGDPLVDIHKNIYIYYDGKLVAIYNDATPVIFNTETLSAFTFQVKDPQAKLKAIHDTLNIKYGSMNEEYDEQVMVAKFLKGHEKVLELGANIGRNTLVIGSILKDSSNLVTMECSPLIAQQLEENRTLNNLNFQIEVAALSKRNLIQQGWDTMPSDEVPEGYTKVNTISYSELVSKYNIQFDTIVADCEGALFYIFSDMPEVLDNVNLILMENDYHNIDHKMHVDSILISKGFEKIFSKAGGWGPCYDCFYEAWAKSV